MEYEDFSALVQELASPLERIVKRLEEIEAQLAYIYEALLKK